jgi:hypothetical protein
MCCNMCDVLDVVLVLRVAHVWHLGLRVRNNCQLAHRHWRRTARCGAGAGAGAVASYNHTGANARLKFTLDTRHSTLLLSLVEPR